MQVKQDSIGKPNVMQCGSSSYVILDPKRWNFARYGEFIREKRVWGKSAWLNQYGKKSLL